MAFLPLVNAPAGGQDRQFAFEAVKPTRQPQTPRLGRPLFVLPVAPSGDDFDDGFRGSIRACGEASPRTKQNASKFRHYSRTAHIIIPRTWNLLVFSPFRPDIGEHA